MAMRLLPQEITLLVDQDNRKMLELRVGVKQLRPSNGECDE